MLEIEEKTILKLEQNKADLAAEKLLLQHQSLKLRAISLLTIFFIATSLIIQVFAILERNELDREKTALNLIAESSAIFNQEEIDSVDTLNFLEIVALSHKNNIADRTMIEDYFKITAISNVTKLEDFIEEVDQDNGNRNWKNIRDLVKKWQE
ncbi:MAG: DUF4760 domain-containing protein [Cyanobacteria bacterium P01_F01_bin.143]